MDGPRRVDAGAGLYFSPIQLIPDFIPVIGFLDDAVLVAIMLRIVVRTAGPQMLHKHWPGTSEGLQRCAGSVVWPNKDERGPVTSRGVVYEALGLVGVS